MSATGRNLLLLFVLFFFGKHLLIFGIGISLYTFPLWGFFYIVV